MTTIQICALIVLIILVGLTYWAGYLGGLIDGRIEGIDEGKAIQQSASNATLRNLQNTLEQSQVRHKQALAASSFGDKERQILLAIAEQLRIAADTFSAFRTGKKLERDAKALREQALAMATLLKPVATEDAA